LGLFPSSSFWSQDFKTLQITKDWGWNLDNEQDWVPKMGDFTLGRSQNNYQKTRIKIMGGNRRQTSN